MSAVAAAQGRIQIKRWFTAAARDVYADLEWKKVDVKVGPFEQKDVEAPTFWSESAVGIAASKFFRKAGVPDAGTETSVKQLVERVVQAIRLAGERNGYFGTNAGSADDFMRSKIFEDELRYLLITQRAAFNSPVWFNVGLKEAYGIAGEPAGNWRYDVNTQCVLPTKDSYTNPQSSACFIQSIKDDLMDIAEHVQREMRIFKYGSGSGTNYSSLRAKNEKLSNGGSSSGVLSFLEVFDKSAGAIKSGGTTRRAAKICILDVDHPDIEEFVTWKAREEKKAKALIAAGYESDFNGEAYRTISGQNANNSVRVTDAFMKAVETDGEHALRWRTSGDIANRVSAKALFRTIAQAAWECADPGLHFADTTNRWHTCQDTSEIRAANPCVPGHTLILTRDGDRRIDSLVGQLVDVWNGLQWSAVSPRVTGTNQPLVRVTLNDGAFLDCTPTHQFILADGSRRPAGELAKGEELGKFEMPQVEPGQPRSQSRTVESVESIGTAEKVYCFTEPLNHSGTFNGIVTGQCQEYLFIDNSACNLASLNLVRFQKDDLSFDHEGFAHACRVMFLAQEILVDYASYPTAEICENSHLYRPLGLGYANLGALIMRCGLPYDSDDARQLAAEITSLMTATAYETSCDMAAAMGPFERWKANRKGALSVLEAHYLAFRDLDHDYSPIGRRAVDTWSRVVGKAQLTGIRNAQATLIAPTGTISFLMDCDTTGLEPEFQLVKEKLLAGGGTLYIENRSIRTTLESLGYMNGAVDQIVDHIRMGEGLETCKQLDKAHVPVFDCAVKPPKGTRAIDPMGHIRMLEAIAPFISGSASKTVNCPHETTVEEIEKLYLEAWRRGLKAIAVYRESSKGCQVLTGGKSALLPETKSAQTLPHPVETKRMRLPKKRTGFTQEARVAGQKIYVRTGEYPDGRLGEIFIDMAKEGATMRSMVNTLAIAVSLGLQHGVPLEEYVDVFTYTNFAPNGVVTDHPNIKLCTSPVDYIFRMLALEYLGREDLVQLPPSEIDSEGDTKLDLPLLKPVQPSATRFSDGKLCLNCGNIATRRAGSCYVCEVCFSQTGCA